MTHTSLTQDDPVLKSCTFHRRIQDFVRGGGPRPSSPGGGGGKALLACASLFGGAIFCGEGGAKAPLAPPPGSAHAFAPFNCDLVGVDDRFSWHSDLGKH